jgi:hypothetical protein
VGIRRHATCRRTGPARMCATSLIFNLFGVGGDQRTSLTVGQDGVRRRILKIPAADSGAGAGPAARLAWPAAAEGQSGPGAKRLRWGGLVRRLRHHVSGALENSYRDFLTACGDLACGDSTAGPRLVLSRQGSSTRLGACRRSARVPVSPGPTVRTDKAGRYAAWSVDQGWGSRNGSS